MSRGISQFKYQTAQHRFCSKINLLLKFKKRERSESLQAGSTTVGDLLHSANIAYNLQVTGHPKAEHRIYLLQWGKDRFQVLNHQEKVLKTEQVCRQFGKVVRNKTDEYVVLGDKVFRFLLCWPSRQPEAGKSLNQSLRADSMSERYDLHSAFTGKLVI